MSTQDTPRTSRYSVSKSGIMPRPDLSELESRREPPPPASLPEVHDRDGATTGVFPVVSEGHDSSAVGDSDNGKGS